MRSLAGLRYRAQHCGPLRPRTRWRWRPRRSEASTPATCASFVASQSISSNTTHTACAAASASSPARRDARTRRIARASFKAIVLRSSAVLALGGGPVLQLGLPRASVFLQPVGEGLVLKSPPRQRPLQQIDEGRRVSVVGPALRAARRGRFSIQAIMKFLTTWGEVESAVAIMNILGPGKRVAIGGVSRGRWCGPHNTGGQGCRCSADGGHQYSRLHVGIPFLWMTTALCRRMSVHSRANPSRDGCSVRPHRQLM